MNEDNLLFERIKNQDLVCRSCKFKYNDDSILGNTSRCEIFQLKLDRVLDGGDCSEYIKE